MNSSVYFQGMGMSASLIMAIGMQNAFLLRQGIARKHIFTAAITCLLCDILLISVGIMGMGKLLQSLPSLQSWMALAGAAFVFWFGWQSLKKALRPSALLLDSQQQGMQTAKGVILAALGFSFLNPHSLLDTIVLIGGLGAQQEPGNRPMFMLGAASFSGLWFFSLAFGASKLAPLFAKPIAWRVLDALIAIMMAAIGISLLRMSGIF